MLSEAGIRQSLISWTSAQRAAPARRTTPGGTPRPSPSTWSTIPASCPGWGRGRGRDDEREPGETKQRARRAETKENLKSIANEFPLLALMSKWMSKTIEKYIQVYRNWFVPLGTCFPALSKASCVVGTNPNVNGVFLEHWGLLPDSTQQDLKKANQASFVLSHSVQQTLLRSMGGIGPGNPPPGSHLHHLTSEAGAGTGDRTT